MKSAALLAAALVVGAGAARADDKQAFLGVFAETSAMKMAGMPAMPKINLPPGVKLPPQAQAAMEQMSGKASRKLTVRLWSPGIAPDDAKATLAIPDGLKLGPTLDLALYRPKGAEGDEGAGGGPGGPVNFDEFTIKRYWGSSETVKPGQPDVIEFKGLSDEQKARIKSEAAKARRGAGSLFYKPDWTTGYWPEQNQPGKVESDAALKGHYALTTTYTGNVEIDVPENVNFLDGIDMSSPDLSQKIDFTQSINFKWAAIPNILGYHAQIIGMMQSGKTIIMWDSSEVKPEMGMNYDYMQMSEVRDMVGRNMFMAPDRVSVSVPAGIFNDCDMVMFQMIGYGPGAALDKAQPLPRVQTKTTLMIMLGGKMMRGGPRGFGGQVGLGDPNILTNGE